MTNKTNYECPIKAPTRSLHQLQGCIFFLQKNTQSIVMDIKNRHFPRRFSFQKKIGCTRKAVHLMYILSKRSEDVICVLKVLKEDAIQVIHCTPEEVCTGEDLENILIAAYKKVAKIRHVTVETVRSHCTRGCDIPSNHVFFDLAKDAILGGQKLSHQLVSTCKNNESTSDIISAFSLL